MRKKNKTLLLSVLITVTVFVTLLSAALIRGKILTVRYYTLPASGTNRTSVQSSGNPTSLSAGRFSDHDVVESKAEVKIASLADLHGEMMGDRQEKIVRKIQEMKPDLIFFLGDMVDRTRPFESKEAVVTLTRRLTVISPVYYVEGNHELDLRDSYPEIYALMNEEMQEFGAVRLDNRIVQLSVPCSVDDSADLSETPVNLCGITKHFYWDTEEDALIEQLKEMKGINILLCHYPESVLWYYAFAGGGLDLALCGHTHGGLFRIPFFGGLYAPEQGWRPKYDVGKYSIYTDTDKKNYGGGEGSRFLGTMIISGGLAGEHGIPRINNPREISIIKIN